MARPWRAALLAARGLATWHNPARTRGLATSAERAGTFNITWPQSDVASSNPVVPRSLWPNVGLPAQQGRQVAGPFWPRLWGFYSGDESK